jgi:DNA-binding CsgD family transcriptional regulator
MKKIEIDDRDRQMLELLAKGASNRSIAESLGYREGTMRVYLHGLYRKLGVGNKTSAVIWYFDRLKDEGGPADGAPARLAGAPMEESFGDMALRTSPFAALGAMGMFLGAYGRLWEVGNRLKGAVVDEKADHRRRQSRLLWEAMLKGDFAYGKQLFDDDLTARLLVDAPSDCVLLGCLLRIGGYTKAAERVMTQLIKRKKGRVGISTKEATLLAALRDAMDNHTADGLASLYRLATEAAAKPVPRHAAMAAMYWVYRARKDFDAARSTASALWAEAEAVRQQLQAMGERPLDPKAAVPAPFSTRARSAAAVAAKTTGKAAGARAALVE